MKYRWSALILFLFVILFQPSSIMGYSCPQLWQTLKKKLSCCFPRQYPTQRHHEAFIRALGPKNTVKDQLPIPPPRGVKKKKKKHTSAKVHPAPELPDIPE